MAPQTTLSSYHLAQRALADLKAAVLSTIESHGGEGCTNAEIGRLLSIYEGHKGHEGHIPRTILAFLEREGTIVQDESTKRWCLRPGLRAPDDVNASVGP